MEYQLLFIHKINAQLQLDLNKHNDQYPPIEARTYKSSHDRFLIIDNTEVYHIGASLKDLGKKMFAFSKLELPAHTIIDVLYYSENQKRIDLTIKEIPRNRQYSQIYTLNIGDKNDYYISSPSSNQIV